MIDAYRAGSAWLVRAVLVALVLGLAPAPASAQQAARADNPTGRRLELQTPLQLNGALVGQILLRMEPDGALSVDKQGLLSLIGPRLDPAFTAMLAGLDAADGLDFQTLEDAQVATGLDMGALTVSLDVPVDALARRTLEMSPVASRLPRTAAAARFAAHLNLRAAALRSTSSSAADSDEFLLGLDGAVRYRWPVLQFGLDGSSQEDEARTLERRYTRLLFDMPDSQGRLGFGDLLLDGNAFLGTEDMLGVLYSRDRRRSVLRNARRGVDRQFTLSRSSTVSVEVDGVSLRELRLDPGSYTLADIPLATGYNEVRLVIEDDTGQTDVIDFSAVLDTTLQAPGTLDWSLGAGIRRDLSVGELGYDDEQPVAQAVLRAGISDRLTLESSLRLADGTSLGVFAALRGIRAGTVRTELGVSGGGDASTRWGAAAQYQNHSGRSASRSRVVVGAEYRSGDFGAADALPTRELDLFPDTGTPGAFPVDEETVATVPVDGGESVDAFIDFSRGLGDRTSAGVSVRYAQSNGQDGTLSFGASLRSRSIRLRGLSWSLRAGQRLERDGSSTTSLVAGATYRIGDVAAASRLDAGSETLDLAVRRRVGGSNVGSTSAEAAVRVERDVETQAVLRAGYTANRYLAEVDYRERSELDEAGERRSSASVRVQTALAFADGAVAIGRPVGSSFAILGAHPTLDGRRVRVEPRPDGESARTGWFGNALLPDVGYLGTRQIDYEVPDLPLGYDLGSGAFYVAPPLNGGYALTVGSAAVMTVIGTLIDEGSGEPVSLVSGSAAAVAAAEGDEPVVFFTNRSGRFALSGVAPGDYSLRLDTSPPREMTLAIPDTGEILLRIGEIQFP